MEELEKQLKIQSAKHEKEKATWENEHEEWVFARKRLGT